MNPPRGLPVKLFLPALLLSLLLAAPALAHPGGHGGGYGGGYVPAPTPEPTPQPRTAIPESYAEVVTTLKEQLAAARKAIGAARIVDLHRSCDALEDLADAVPGKLGTVSEDARSKVQKAATDLAATVAVAVEKADAGDLKAASTSLDAANGAIAVIEAQGTATAE
jgi:hypothetical protein